MSDRSISQSLAITVPQAPIDRGKRHDWFAGPITLALPEATGKAWTVGPGSGSCMSEGGAATHIALAK